MRPDRKKGAERDQAWSVLLTGLLLLPFTTALGAVVLSDLWRWFLMDHFHLPPITVLEAAGLDLLVSIPFLSLFAAVAGDSTPREVFDRALIYCLGCLLTLLSGLVIVWIR